MAVWGRLCLGTGLLFHRLEGALDASSGWGLLGRIGGGVAGALLLDGVVSRQPALVYAVPLVWLFAAWRVSDSSATPPPEAVPPAGDVLAVERMEVARVVPIAEGVGCILHPVREEVTEP
ncbi:hypothetical protein AB0903_31040 [Streptomyces sp. NPDC048389]|uniref:hypothetical protein n=1 Tax=Streptomyces sp. NPDC048389 TaxID=3154622 RepID=UPI003455894E